MVSINVFGKTCSGAKNSRLGTLSGFDFKNLGVVSTPLKCFSNDLENGVGHGS
jgi:hypothetical protein